jgi:hypothetical protein
MKTARWAVLAKEPACRKSACFEAKFSIWRREGKPESDNPTQIAVRRPTPPNLFWKQIKVLQQVFYLAARGQTGNGANCRQNGSAILASVAAARFG